MTPGNVPAYTRFIPEYLKPLGYRTYHSGKWHMRFCTGEGGVGFDHSYTMLDEDRFFTPTAHRTGRRAAASPKPERRLLQHDRDRRLCGALPEGARARRMRTIRSSCTWRRTRRISRCRRRRRTSSSTRTDSPRAGTRRGSASSRACGAWGWSIARWRRSSRTCGRAGIRRMRNCSPRSAPAR